MMQWIEASNTQALLILFSQNPPPKKSKPLGYIGASDYISLIYHLALVSVNFL